MPYMFLTLFLTTWFEGIIAGRGPEFSSKSVVSGYQTLTRGMLRNALVYPTGADNWMN